MDGNGGIGWFYMIIHSYCGSFPHSRLRLLSTSKFFFTGRSLNPNRWIDPWMQWIMEIIPWTLSSRQCPVVQLYKFGTYQVILPCWLQQWHVQFQHRPTQQASESDVTKSKMQRLPNPGFHITYRYHPGNRNWCSVKQKALSGVLSQLWGIHIPTSESGFYKNWSSNH